MDFDWTIRSICTPIRPSHWIISTGLSHTNGMPLISCRQTRSLWMTFLPLTGLYQRLVSEKSHGQGEVKRYWIFQANPEKYDVDGALGQFRK